MLTMLSGQESRKHLRVDADPTAPIRVDIMGRGFLDVLHARDISVGGLGIRVAHGFAGCDIHSEVELIITLGRARPFKAVGVIRHSSQSERAHVFGVEFKVLTAEQRAAIDEYIRVCLRRQSRSAMHALGARARGALRSV